MNAKDMKMKNTVISLTIAVTKSTWTRPAQITLALAVALFGVIGCKPHH